MSSPLRLLVFLVLALGTLAPAFLAIAERAEAVTRLHPVKGTLHTKICIADQKKDMFEDDRFLGLGVKYARRSVSWDVTRDPRLTQEFDEWLQAARKAEALPLITFAR